MTDMTVAKTVLDQLGGARFVATTGAKNLAGTEDSLSFQIGRNPKRVTLVRVTLTPADTYAVTFFRTGKLRTDGRRKPETAAVGRPAETHVRCPKKYWVVEGSPCDGGHSCPTEGEPNID